MRPLDRLDVESAAEDATEQGEEPGDVGDSSAAGAMAHRAMHDAAVAEAVRLRSGSCDSSRCAPMRAKK